jgi:hypothetical protein
MSASRPAHSIVITQTFPLERAERLEPTLLGSLGTLPPIFDHLFGAGEQCWRDREAQRLCGLQVDDQIELETDHRHHQLLRVRCSVTPVLPGKG